MKSMTDQRVVVTGSTYGIGLGIAQAMLEAGARVVLNSNQDPEDDVLDRLSQIGECHFVAADLSAISESTRLIEEAGALLGGLDCLVNNAGTFINTPFSECDESDYDRIMNLNVRGYYFASQAFVKAVGKRKFDASIVCTGSTNGLLAEKESTLYDISKGAVLMLVRSLSLVLADSGIRINGIGPGLIRTPLHEKLVGVDSTLCRLIEAQIPLGRRGELDDVGPVAVFLASPAARYMTGQMIYVDGGITAQQIVWEMPDGTSTG